MNYEWNPDWFQGWAAMLQAVLSALAVFAAAALQDRGFAKRDAGIRNQRLEGIAAVARYANSVVSKVTERIEDGMDPARALTVCPDGFLSAAMRALTEIEPASIGDLELTNAFLHMEDRLNAVANAFGKIRMDAQHKHAGSTPVPARGILGGLPTELFNAAASVERRVAHLVGRPAHL